jgi:hypothetical protein
MIKRRTLYVILQHLHLHLPGEGKQVRAVMVAVWPDGYIRGKEGFI